MGPGKNWHLYQTDPKCTAKSPSVNFSGRRSTGHWGRDHFPHLYVLRDAACIGRPASTPNNNYRAVTKQIWNSWKKQPWFCHHQIELSLPKRRPLDAAAAILRASGWYKIFSACTIQMRLKPTSSWRLSCKWSQLIVLLSNKSLLSRMVVSEWITSLESGLIKRTPDTSLPWRRYLVFSPIFITQSVGTQRAAQTSISSIYSK